MKRIIRERYVICQLSLLLSIDHSEKEREKKYHSLEASPRIESCPRAFFHARFLKPRKMYTRSRAFLPLKPRVLLSRLYGCVLRSAPCTSIINKNARGGIVVRLFSMGLVENDEAYQRGARHGAHAHTRARFYLPLIPLLCSPRTSFSPILFLFPQKSLKYSFIADGERNSAGIP